jgi:tetratricopeptide (TPR) repeat protein
LQSLGRTEDAIKALTILLSHSPTDAESWSHLASLYRTQGLYQQSIFCLEEVLLIHPNAYTIHARIGETLYLQSGGNNPELLADSMRYYCRSVELCEWYLRGWYGLKLVTDRILMSGAKEAGHKKTVEGLNELATSKLLEIVRRRKAGDKGWQGFDEAEVEAARELVSPDEIVR